MNSKNCYLCSTINSTTLYAVSGQYKLFRCSNCSLVFTDASEVKSIAGLYQEENYYSEKGGSGFNIDDYLIHGLAAPTATHYNRERFQPLFQELNRLEQNKTIHYLDIGCSAGLMLAIARDHGWKTKGIETSPVAVNEAKGLLKLDVECNTLDGANLPASHYEAISLFHVLEHLPDPREALKKIHEALTQEGILAIEVPNIRSLPAMLRKKSWHGYVLPYHLWHFSKTTLKELLAQTGFEVIKTHTPYIPCAGASIFNAHGFLTSLVRQVVRKRKARNIAVASAPPSHLVKSPRARDLLQRLVVLFYWPIDKLMEITGTGEAVYILARKK